ncbi:hypothetical protein GM3708_1556 [Geminocystis sp. NIES-3708]|uniref:hypothetical protein n=1 Tax=Geminocystis sp. NIES-3708 TaxID=1615909 RepID=UPI0005FC3F77|nr:hypothetical protein [Geminocystis sp. NIES-3708]BAQ61150.1 hypothetical protein GM3708_1556 [Geminocystis sp. NIES-3708]
MNIYFLECYGEGVTDDPRVNFFLPSLMAFSFFAIESLTNVVYIQFIQDSLKKIKDIDFKNKIKEINEQLNISEDEFSELETIIDEMKKFRNNLVHSKPLKIEHGPYYYENNSDAIGYIPTKIYEIKNLFNRVNKDNVQKFIETVNDLEEMWDKQCQKQFNREIIFSQVMQIKNTP